MPPLRREVGTRPGVRGQGGEESGISAWEDGGVTRVRASTLFSTQAWTGSSRRCRSPPRCRVAVTAVAQRFAVRRDGDAGMGPGIPARGRATTVAQLKRDALRAASSVSTIDESAYV